MFSFLKGGSKDYKDDEINDDEFNYEEVFEAIHKAGEEERNKEFYENILSTIFIFFPKTA